MMEFPLTISSLIAHAGRYHSQGEIAAVDADGSILRSTWGEVENNSLKLASALAKLGLAKGDRVATIAMNNIRHLELYFGTAGAGYVCHTINPRLFPEQLTYIINDAADRILFVEPAFLPLITGLREQLPTLEHIVTLGPRNSQQTDDIPGLLFYDELIKTGDGAFQWPDLHEHLPSSLCYTSGTTGNPKGVEYTHRSTVLHSIVAATPDALGMSARDSLLLVVPMFHANGWGLPYVAAMTGAKLVLPGFALDGESLLRLIQSEGVTFAAGVPTVWAGLLDAAGKAGTGLGRLNRTIVGGAACPPTMIKTFNEEYGVEVVHAWGMTETSPLGTSNQLLAKHQDLEPEELLKLRAKQGRPPFGVELRVIDDIGNTIADPETPGKLQIKGHWVAERYYGASQTALVDGWFDTGDIATIDADGFMQIRDRAKDVIKSGGEWISSVELESIAMEHPGVADVAAIGIPHPKWDERPLLLVKPVSGATPTEDDLLNHFEGRIAKWQVPDRVIMVDDIKRNATGKIPKHELREAYADIFTPQPSATDQP